MQTWIMYISFKQYYYLWKKLVRLRGIKPTNLTDKELCWWNCDFEIIMMTFNDTQILFLKLLFVAEIFKFGS